MKGATMKLAVIFWQNVKKANRNFLPFLLSLVLLTTAAAANTSVPTKTAQGESSNALSTTVVPSVSFKKMWIDYDITQGGVKGMRIHTSFEAYNMKGIAGYLALFFQDNAGTFLQDSNNKFVSSDGEVAAYMEINPGYNPTTVYDDLAIFMPYSELDLSDGVYALKIKANVIYKQGGIIGNLTTYNFDYTQGNAKAGATFDRVWVDYDVSQGGQKGMLVHVKFTVNNMKSVSGRLAVYFQKSGGGKLITTNRLYRSQDPDRVGELVVYFDIVPGYQKTVYEDAQVFLPYSQLNAILPRGDHDLQMDIDVVYQGGALIQHLQTEEFVFSR